MPGEIPVACRLSDLELRARKATLIAQFKSAFIEVEELDNGYAFAIAGDREGILLATELIIAEHECCPFLTFSLSVGVGSAPAHLRVTGPDGTKELLAGLLT